MDKISLLIPSFNDERILEILLELEEYPRDKFEIIVQDGGSPQELIKKIQGLMQPSDLLVVEIDSGIFDAINKGIANCRNDYILTIGTDDLVTCQAVDAMFRCLALERRKAYFMGVRMVNPETLRLVRYWPVRRFSRANIFLGVQYPHFGFLAHRDVYPKSPFNVSNKINADYEFFYALSKKLTKSDVGYITDATVMMRLGGTSTKNFSSILGHQKLIISFALRKNPLLLPGILLKPIYKLQELLLGVYRR